MSVTFVVLRLVLTVVVSVSVTIGILWLKDRAARARGKMTGPGARKHADE